jgi:hypothetical protein
MMAVPPPMPSPKKSALAGCVIMMSATAIVVRVIMSAPLLGRRIANRFAASATDIDVVVFYGYLEYAVR